MIFGIDLNQPTLLLNTNIVKRGNFSSRFSSNSKANASELLENLEEMFTRYNIDNDVISRFKSSPHAGVWAAVKGLKSKKNIYQVHFIELDSGK